MKPTLPTTAVLAILALTGLLASTGPLAAATTPEDPPEIPCVNASTDPPGVTVDPDCIGEPPLAPPPV